MFSLCVGFLKQQEQVKSNIIYVLFLLKILFELYYEKLHLGGLYFETSAVAYFVSSYR